MYNLKVPHSKLSEVFFKDFARILRLEKAEGAKHIPSGWQPRICERRATQYKRKRQSLRFEAVGAAGLIVLRPAHINPTFNINLSLGSSGRFAATNTAGGKFQNIIGNG